MNQSGFIHVFALGIIGIICTILFSLYLLKNKSLVEQDTRHLCLKNFFKAQEQAKNSIEKILSLNRQAKIARQNKKVAEKTVQLGIATANPKLIAAGRAALNIANLHIKHIKIQQQALIYSSEMTRQLSVLKLSQEIKSYLVKKNAPLREKLSFSASSLAVRKKSPILDPPDYELKQEFTKEQALHASWKYHQEIQGKFLWNTKEVSKKISCTVSLSESKGKLKIVTVEDKF